MHISDFKSKLNNCVLEINSPYNDGYSQLYYKERYDELIKIGEKKYNQQIISSEIQNLEKKIKLLNDDLNELKLKLENI